MGKANERGASFWPVVVFAATLLVLSCLVVKLFLTAEVSIPLVVAIATLSGLLILSPRVADLAELSVSKDGLVAKVRDVERQVERAERKLDALFAQTMSDSMFTNLRKLAGGRFGHFRADEGLRRELQHLRDIGYITSGHIRDMPGEGPDLSAFVAVTPLGLEFVALRESMEGPGSAPGPTSGG